MYREFCCGARTIYNRGAGSLAEIQMAAHKVGVEMSFKNEFDAGIAFMSQLQVRFDITKRIYHGRFTVIFNIIGRLTQTGSI